MTAAHEVSAVREPIGIAEKMQQYFRDFRDFDTFEHRSFMPFLIVEKKNNRTTITISCHNISK